jgi:hypothetical protein
VSPGRIAASLAVALATTSAAGVELRSGLTWGADLRLRQVVIGNVGLNDLSPIADRNFQRLRARLWGGYAGETVEASARLMWEGRHYGQPDRADWPAPGFEEWYSGDLLLDNLSLTLKDIGGAPLALKLGRQDIILGNGWLVLDGTPLDGSRTLYFDAARATWAGLPADTSLELIYIDQSADTGRFPAPLGGGSEDQVEQDERGALLYLRNRGLRADTDLDAYLIYKENRPKLTPGNLRVNNGAPFPSPADDGEVYAAGLRAESRLAPNWAARAEAAYEWGRRNGRDLSALGLNARVSWARGDGLGNLVHLGYEYLSGDDPDTRNDEAFDPLWGRWPQWSELMIYQWPLDSRVGEATNLHRVNLGWGAKPHSTTEVSLDYHALWADQESTRTPGQLANLSREGRFRGHLITAWLKPKLNRQVSGHLVAEYLVPGDFYADNRQDDSYFVRAELNLAW